MKRLFFQCAAIVLAGSLGLEPAAAGVSGRWQLHTVSWTGAQGFRDAIVFQAIPPRALQYTHQREFDPEGLAAEQMQIQAVGPALAELTSPSFDWRWLMPSRWQAAFLLIALAASYLDPAAGTAIGSFAMAVPRRLIAVNPTSTILTILHRQKSASSLKELLPLLKNEWGTLSPEGLRSILMYLRAERIVELHNGGAERFSLTEFGRKEFTGIQKIFDEHKHEHASKSKAIIKTRLEKEVGLPTRVPEPSWRPTLGAVAGNPTLRTAPAPALIASAPTPPPTPAAPVRPKTASAVREARKTFLSEEDYLKERNKLFGWRLLKEEAFRLADRDARISEQQLADEEETLADLDAQIQQLDVELGKSRPASDEDLRDKINRLREWSLSVRPEARLRKEDLERRIKEAETQLEEITTEIPRMQESLQTLRGIQEEKAGRIGDLRSKALQTRKNASHHYSRLRSVEQLIVRLLQDVLPPLSAEESAYLDGLVASPATEEAFEPSVEEPSEGEEAPTPVEEPAAQDEEPPGKVKPSLDVAPAAIEKLLSEKSDEEALKALYQSGLAAKVLRGMRRTINWQSLGKRVGMEPKELEKLLHTNYGITLEDIRAWTRLGASGIPTDITLTSMKRAVRERPVNKAIVEKQPAVTYSAGPATGQNVAIPPSVRNMIQAVRKAKNTSALDAFTKWRDAAIALKAGGKKEVTFSDLNEARKKSPAAAGVYYGKYRVLSADFVAWGETNYSLGEADLTPEQMNLPDSADSSAPPTGESNEDHTETPDASAPVTDSPKVETSAPGVKTIASKVKDPEIAKARGKMKTAQSFRSQAIEDARRGTQALHARNLEAAQERYKEAVRLMQIARDGVESSEDKERIGGFITIFDENTTHGRNTGQKWAKALAEEALSAYEAADEFIKAHSRMEKAARYLRDIGELESFLDEMWLDLLMPLQKNVIKEGAISVGDLGTLDEIRLHLIELEANQRAENGNSHKQPVNGLNNGAQTPSGAKDETPPNNPGELEKLEQRRREDIETIELDVDKDYTSGFLRKYFKGLPLDKKRRWNEQYKRLVLHNAYAKLKGVRKNPPPGGWRKYAVAAPVLPTLVNVYYGGSATTIVEVLMLAGLVPMIALYVARLFRSPSASARPPTMNSPKRLGIIPRNFLSAA